MTVELTDQTERLAGLFKALSDPTRLQIVGYLMCCPEFRIRDSRETLIGATIGDVCCRVEGTQKVTPRISHHVKELRIAGVIDVERQGRYMVCRINQDAARMIGEFAGSLCTCCTENEQK
jgi:ArsR family transcriptional regulator